MTPEEERQLYAYLDMLMSGGQAPADIGAGLFPTTNEDKYGDTNYFQDRVQMLGDPLTGALAGPGAMDYSVFDPTYERNYLDEAPQGEVLMNQWAGSSPGSAKYLMYDLMYGNGVDGRVVDGMTAWNMLRDATNEESENYNADNAAKILASLPPGQIDLKTGTFAKGPDSQFASLWGEVQDLEAAVSANPSGALFDDATGRYYTETEVPSEMAAAFAEMGLPTPDQRYQPIVDSMMRNGNAGLGSENYNAERNQLTQSMRKFLGPNAPGAAERAAAIDKYGPMATTAQQTRASDWADNLTGQPNEMGVQGIPSPGDEGGTRGYVPPSTAGGASLEDVPQEWRLNSEREALGLPGPGLQTREPGAAPSLWGGVGARATGDPIGDTGIGGRAQAPGISGALRQAQGAAFNPDRFDRQKRSRDLQQQMFDNSRSRMASKGNRTMSARDLGAMMRARDDGNTPFMDAIQQRMLQQQISGF